ncbi:MAG: hypothetical protein VX000_07935, partial [Myxococcota bacterium]|nr:hypothetical protein [Myxococcota bacterium]
GGGLEYDLYTLTYEGGGQSASPGSYSNVTVGPHIGYKIAGEGGFTFSWDYGIGYQLTFGSDDAQAALAISAPSIADSRVASMGSLNMGWSF